MLLDVLIDTHPSIKDEQHEDGVVPERCPLKTLNAAANGIIVNLGVDRSIKKKKKKQNK